MYSYFNNNIITINILAMLIQKRRCPEGFSALRLVTFEWQFGRMRPHMVIVVFAQIEPAIACTAREFAHLQVDDFNVGPCIVSRGQMFVAGRTEQLIILDSYVFVDIVQNFTLGLSDGRRRFAR